MAKRNKMSKRARYHKGTRHDYRTGGRVGYEIGGATEEEMLNQKFKKYQENKKAAPTYASTTKTKQPPPIETEPQVKIDKAQDDRFPNQNWPFVNGPIDIIILEGWCLGSQPQATDLLLKPVNKLEETKDSNMVWRTYVNNQLQTNYSELFKSIDKLIFSSRRS